MAYDFDTLLAARKATAYRVEDLRVATFGNSIWAGVFNISPIDDAVIRTPGFTLISNGGVAGNTSAMMLARVATVPDAAQIVLFGEGPNDNEAAVPVSTHYSNLYAIGQALLARGMSPVLILSSPRNTKATNIGGYVAAELTLARDLGIPVMDCWPVTLSSGDWLDATGDPIHNNYTGLSLAADNLAACINGSRPTSFAPRANVSGIAPYCLAGGNNLMMTDTNADGVPDGWVLAGSATGSLVAATGAFKGQFARITGAGATGSPYLRKFITTGWQAGDELLVSCVIGAGGTSLPNNQVNFQISVDGVLTSPILSANRDIPTQRMFFTIKPTTLTQLEFYAKINGVGTGHYIQVGEFEVYNLTACRTR